MKNLHATGQSVTPPGGSVLTADAAVSAYDGEPVRIHFDGEDVFKFEGISEDNGEMVTQFFGGDYKKITTP
jgi:hypothetical protein